MKRIKKMAGGALTDSSGNTVRSSDGEEVRYGDQENKSPAVAEARREEAKSEEPAKAAQPKFGAAFAEARKAGLKTFEHNGKKYTTQLKEDAPKKAVEAPKKAVEAPKKAVEAPKKAGIPHEDLKYGDSGYGRGVINTYKAGIPQEDSKYGDSGYGRGVINTSKAGIPHEDLKYGDSGYGRGSINMKKGGSVKSSAPSRADGIAQRGKTRGRVV